MHCKTDRESFGAFISALRKKREYSLEQVCEGLCTAQRLSQLERGKQSAGKLLQDAILERLGVGAEDYEQYLHYREYAHWKMRQKILHRISCGEVAGAKELLEDYCRQYEGDLRGGEAVGERLERQFYLGMWAQIRCLEGAGQAEMHEITEEAVQLTVPGLWEKPLRGRVLSLKEWNLVLEAERYREGGGDEKHYREILDCLETAGMDSVGMAKIYPKAVYFMYKYSAGRETGEGLLGYCNYAVEILRNASRMYYLWELLSLRKRCLEQELEMWKKGTAGRKTESDITALCRILRETEGWIKALEMVYTDYGVPKETFHYCYFYLEKGVSCISDVIRIRRIMLGMKAEELCMGICDIKTLRRLENKKQETRRAIVEELFERLGLPGELVRTELLTESPEARQMLDRLRWYGNQRATQKQELLLSEVKKLISAEIRCNRQVLIRKEINLQDNRGDLGREEYYRRMRAALELTLPFEAFLREGEKYLTQEEQCCIQNMMQKMDKESDEYEACMKRFEEMYRPIAEEELLGTVRGIYNLIMGYIGSELGNKGELDKADRYSESIVREELRSRHMASVATGLYDRWWNYAERKRKGISADRVLDKEVELGKCISFSALSRQEYYESFYRKKLIQN